MNKIFISLTIFLFSLIVCFGLLFSEDAGNSSLKKYDDANNGYSFLYPSMWDFKEDKNGQNLTFKSETGDNASIRIFVYKSESYRSSSGKWGVFTYHYEDKSKIWKITSPSESGEGSDVEEIPSKMTKGGLPYTVEDRQNVHTFIFALHPGIYLIAVTVDVYPETQRMLFVNGVAFSLIPPSSRKE